MDPAAAVPEDFDARKMIEKLGHGRGDDGFSRLSSGRERVDLLGKATGVTSRGRSGDLELLGHAPGSRFGPRQVIEQNRDVIARRFRCPIERDAMFRELVRARIEFARDPVKLAGRFVAELHQVLRDHGQLGAIVLDALREDSE